MNEEISKLIKQNEVSRLCANPNGVGARYKMVDGDPAKLVELVVRECARVVFNKTGPKTALDVLEHFGIKE